MVARRCRGAFATIDRSSDNRLVWSVELACMQLTVTGHDPVKQCLPKGTERIGHRTGMPARVRSRTNDV